jgi:hypothetical protein
MTKNFKLFKDVNTPYASIMMVKQYCLFELFIINNLIFIVIRIKPNRN